MTPTAHMLAVEHLQLSYTFYAYAAVFLAMFLFMYRMSQHARALHREVEILREEYEEASPKSVRDVGNPLNS